MIIRLGYVAIALSLPKVTTSSTVTFAYYNRMNESEREKKLLDVTRSNLNDLEKILFFNVENDIHFYRLTSKLIPLATHKEVYYDYLNYYKGYLKNLGLYIKRNNLRIDSHPDQFNVINSEKEQVFLNTIDTLTHQLEIYEAMEYEEGLMVLHIGSGKKTKDEAMERFVTNFKRMPTKIQKRIILENDDTTFTAFETLKLCQRLNIPMVLDIHHHFCNNNGESLNDLIVEIFNTWESSVWPPKIHVSSPKDDQSIRSHHDYINVFDFISFLETAKIANKSFDVMIEAKQKDLALFQLVRDLKENTDYFWIDSTTFEVK